MLQYKHKKKKMEMIYVCYIICMLHYQELTPGNLSLTVNTVKFEKALGLSAF